MSLSAVSDGIREFSHSSGSSSGRVDNLAAGAIWCAVPVYNNSRSVLEVVKGCLEILPGRVVVVDDGSTDSDLGELLGGLDITLLRHEGNRGKGAAILTASRYIEGQGGVHMITIDADGQHFPSDMTRFFPLLRFDDDILLIGARDFSPDNPNVPAKSRFGRKFANFWLSLEAGVKVSDCQSGFRSYPVRHINQLSFRGNGFDFEAEALARAAWAGIKLMDVDINVAYPKPEERVSHFKPYLDNAMLTHRHALLILRRLAPWPHKKLIKRERPDFKLLLHPVALLKTLLSEHATPTGLAVAAALGVFLGAIPLLFSHSIVILYVATRLNLNKLMALNSQHICMPPFVPVICIEVGYYMRNGKFLPELSYDTLFVQFKDRIIEWLLGSLVVAPVLSAAVGLIVYFGAVYLRTKKAGANV